MDVRNANVDPIIEHDGTCYSYFMFEKGEFRAESEGSYLELVCEFELKPGARLEPHSHDSYEFYYILEGEAIMQIEDEQRRVAKGDLIRIPRNHVHSIWPAEDGGTFRGLAFAASFAPEGQHDKVGVLPEPRVLAS